MWPYRLVSIVSGAALTIAAPVATTGATHALEPHVACRGVVRIIARSRRGPLVPAGGSRFHDLEYLVAFTGVDRRGEQASYAFVTRDLFCGPYPDHPEIVAKSGRRNYSGPYVGLEPDTQTFVVVTSDDGSTYILERRQGGAYTTPTRFHAGRTAISMQRIGDSLDRLTISDNAGDGRIATQTVRTADPSTWGPLLSTPFSSSYGAAGKSRRATAAWTGNPTDVNEIVMAWAYDSRHDGDRVIRYALNPDYRTNAGWRAAKTLVSMKGKDLGDPRVSRWGGSDARVLHRAGPGHR